MLLRIDRHTITTTKSVCLLIAGLFLLPIYIDLMGTLSTVIGFSTKITTYLYYGVLWALLMSSIPQIVRSLTTKIIFGILLFLFWTITLFVFFPNSLEFLAFQPLMNLVVFSPTTLVSVVPYILIGLAIDDTQVLSQYLHIGARIGNICGALSYVLAIANGLDIHYDDMNNAYAVCVVVCILVANYKKNDIYFIMFGCFCLLLAGTRGPLLCVAVVLMIRILILDTNSPKKALKLGFAILLIILLQSDFLVKLADLISEGFAAIGVTQLRIVDYIREGMLTDSSGRDMISSQVAGKIMERPLLGYGPGGDRLIIASGSYVHNMFLEMWISYGVVVGTLILGWMGYWVIRSILARDKSLASIATALFGSVVVKLFLSSSYLYSKELFLTLGICIAGCATLRRTANQYIEGDRND